MYKSDGGFQYSVARGVLESVGAFRYSHCGKVSEFRTRTRILE